MRNVILLICISIAQISFAQNRDEWFHQKRTQKKYLLEQIAALRVYLDYAKKGYDIASHGLTTIEHIKKGDFELHDDFLSRLKVSNSKLKGLSLVAEISFCQLRILKMCKDLLKGIGNNASFNVDEVQYCQLVLNRMLEASLKNIDMLVLIVSSNDLQMNDSERLERIMDILDSVRQEDAFISSFGKGLVGLGLQGSRERADIEYSKLINGIR